MNEIFDRLLVRIFLVFVIIGILYLYRYLHFLFYPTLRNQVTKKLYPSENPTDTLHLFSRWAGLAILLSALNFDESQGLFLSVFHFIVWGLLVSCLYLASLYLIESITLYNFEYKDEILKKKNLTYALICSSHALSTAFVMRALITQAENSLVILFILWLLGIVIMGFGSKYFNLISKLQFERLVTRDNRSLAFSYMGFSMGLCWLVSESFYQEHYDIILYCVQVILRVLLSLILYPLLQIGFLKILKIDWQRLQDGSLAPEANLQNWGLGIFEAGLFFTCALLTSLLVNHIQFGTIYPFF
jgi:hypothetical protein